MEIKIRGKKPRTTEEVQILRDLFEKATLAYGHWESSREHTEGLEKALKYFRDTWEELTGIELPQRLSNINSAGTEENKEYEEVVLALREALKTAQGSRLGLCVTLDKDTRLHFLAVLNKKK